MKKPTSICVFGDSTAWGAWDLEKGGWVKRLWLDIGIRDDDYVELYNCSLSGGTTYSILERFENEARVRNADAIIFQTGGNDAACDAQGVPEVSIEKFRDNLEEIIRRSKEITQNILFMDLRNCDESKTTPVSWVESYYTNKNILEYSNIMEDVCRENGVLFMDIAPLDNEDFEDGLHPNAKGHQKVFEQAKGFLEDNGWI